MTSAIDRWDKEEKRGGRHYFGLLSLILNEVTLGSGAGYTIEGIYDQTGGLHQFVGKHLATDDDPKTSIHVVAVLECEDKAGNLYKRTRDGLTWEKSIARYTAPSLQKVFGKNFKKVLTDGSEPVEVEEVSYTERGKDGQDYDRKAFKVLRKFANVDAMREAREAYFAEIGDKEPSVSEQTIKDGATLYRQLGMNQEVFKEVVSTHPKFAKLPFDAFLADVVFEAGVELSNESQPV
jgi:hypothetical protein